MTEEGSETKGPRARVSDGIKQGIGVLSAFRDAIEETINEARERGDLSSDRAREVMKSALERAQEAAEGARERLDFVPQKDFDGLARKVDELQARLDRMEAAMRASPGVRTPDPTPDDGAGTGGVPGG